MQVHPGEAGPAAEPLDSYVMVDREDVVEAIGAFVAAYLVQLPEAHKLKPEELQVAVKHAFQVLHLPNRAFSAPQCQAQQV